MAVAMNMNGACLIGKTRTVDSARIGLADNELVEQQTMRREFARSFAKRGIDQGRVFITETEERGRLYANERLFL